MWAKDLKLDEFELLCLDGTRKPVAEAESCHLAKAPNHGVVTRQDKTKYLEEVLFDQQVRAAGPPALPTWAFCRVGGSHRAW